MSVIKLEIDAELQAAERALESATERRRVAEQALWEAVRTSGNSSKKQWRRVARVDEARAELADAEQALTQTQALVAELRKRLAYAQEREARLLAVTETIIARDEARRANGTHGHGGNGGDPHKPGRRPSFFDRFRRG